MTVRLVDELNVGDCANSGLDTANRLIRQTPVESTSTVYEWNEDEATWRLSINTDRIVVDYETGTPVTIPGMMRCVLQIERGPETWTLERNPDGTWLAIKLEVVS